VQGSMFDDPPGSDEQSSDELERMTYEASEATFFDPAEEFSQESMETDLDHVIEQEATSFEAQELQENNSAHEHVEPVQQSLQDSHEGPMKQVEPTETIIAEGSHADPGATETIGVLTADDFASLEDRVLRAIALVKRERDARVAAEAQVAALELQNEELATLSRHADQQCQALEAQLREHQAQSPMLERLEREVESLRTEREQVRQRVEKLLGQLDALEL
jgi:hypothetical protein